MSEIERAVAKMLRVAGVLERDVEWMARSCPSLAHADAEVARRQGVERWADFMPKPQRLVLDRDQNKTPEEIGRERLRIARERVAWRTKTKKENRDG